MNESNKKRQELLGMPFGTANAKLRKALLFSCVVKLGLDTCFRCSKIISTLEEFSIEHKISWQGSDDPIKFFFDLENISFSHIRCNTLAGSKFKIYNSIEEREKAKYQRRYSNPVSYRRHLDNKIKNYRLRK